MSLAADPWIPLAEVARPHGVRGEVRLKLFNRDSNVLLELDEVLVRLKDGEEQEVSIDRARRADDAILLKLFSVDDRDRADELRGALICTKRSQFPPLEEGEFYVCDIVGAQVVMKAEGGAEQGEVLGVVHEFSSYPSVDVLVVRAADGGKNWEIPLVEAFVAGVDAEKRIVTVNSLEGFERG